MIGKTKIFALLLGTALTSASVAYADTISSEDSLKAALLNGGSHILEGDITISSALGDIAGNVIIDGGMSDDGTGGYTINGNSKDNGFVLNSSDSSLTLQNMILSNFGSSNINKGFMVDNTGGTVNLKNVKISGNTITTVPSADMTSGPVGALIKNTGIFNFDGTFSDNKVETSADLIGQGGFITNYKGTVSLNGTFRNNTVSHTYEGGEPTYGGIYWQNGTGSVTTNISGTFEENLAYSSSDSAAGSVVYNNLGTIDSITGTFSKNEARAGKGTSASGGAVYNKATITNITADFIGNKVKNSEMISTYAKNYSAMGGAIYNSGYMTIKNSTFEDNTAEGSKAYGGAIYQLSHPRGETELKIINSTFRNNTAKELGSKEGFGGAVYAEGSVTIRAEDGGETRFSGNKMIAQDSTKTSNAIYLARASGGTKPDLFLEAETGGSIVFDDALEAKKQTNKTYISNITITGDETGRVEFNNAVKNFGEVSATKVILALGKTNDGQADLSDVAVSMKSGKLDLENGEIQEVNMKSFSTDNTLFGFDADMESGVSDKIKTTAGSSGNLTIDSVKILKDNANGGTLTLFENSGSGSTNVKFIGLDDFAAYTDQYKYTFTDSGNGVLQAIAEANMSGLKLAVADDEAEDKSYTVAGDASDVKSDLGALHGNKLIIEGVGNTLSGNNYAGITIEENQSIEIRNAVVEGFNSEEGGFINSEGSLFIKNTDMENNSSSGNGGAVYSSSNVQIVVDDGKTHQFSGNKANVTDGEGQSNAVFMAGGELNLQANDGTLIFNDTIDGAGYDLNITGGVDSNIAFNNIVSGADNVNINDLNVTIGNHFENVGIININGGKVLLGNDNLLDGNNISLNSGGLHLNNAELGVSQFALLKGGNGLLHFDLDTVKGVSDLIKAEKLEGVVNVVGHNIGGDDTDYAGKYTDNARIEPSASDDKNLRDSIKFAEITESDNGAFKIFRVEDSAYEWEAYSKEGEEGKEDWLMKIKKSDDDNNNSDDNNNGNNTGAVVSEVAAYLGLPSAGFEQTRDLLHNVEDKVSSTMGYYDNCHGYYDYSYDGAALKNLWIAPRYSASKVKSPVRYDADIYGFEAGADIQSDIHNRLGGFVSYRHGEYDFNGKTDYYRASGSSDTDIDSYLLGLYYRYTSQRWWATGMVFGGMLDADMKTYDGVKADTKGKELGAAITTGYGLSLSKSLMLEPQAGIGYTLIDWDNFADDYKKVRLNKASQFELEAGVKLEKTFALDSEPAKVFVKPSIIQIISDGGKVKIGDLSELNGLDNAILGKVAAGASYHVDEHWSIFGDVAYTFGSDYRNTAAQVGLNYAF